MNQKLWNNILAFHFDAPLSGYGFSTRLAKENYWTQDFTQKALLEYRKFMYLAATSEFMVSPSEIVDTVWHQHLIFTQSYSAFCNILGKTIQHIPSTHNREEQDKFRQAKERTKRLYATAFGEQPAEIWEYNGMYESLELPKAKLKIRVFAIIGIFAFIGCTFPAYYLLKPVYIHIDNPDFLLGYITLAVLGLAVLESQNKKYLCRIVSGFKDFSFINHLQPFELVYLKTQQLENVIHGNMSQLVATNQILVNHDYKLEKAGDINPASIEQYEVFTTLEKGKLFYSKLLPQLIQKPVFTNIAGSMDALKKYFIKSKVFARLFCLNFIVLSVLLMLLITRLATGMARDKPVTYIFIACIAFVIFMTTYLVRLTKLFCTHSIPAHYKDQLVLARQSPAADTQWQYFLGGTPALAMAFIPVIEYPRKNTDTSSGGASCGSSGGSSCGSSCSSCGGCGGD